MVADLVIIGLGITLEPFPLTAFILLLSTEKGARKGLAFILGWLACLVVVIGAVVLVTGGKPPEPNTAPSNAAIAVKLALGVTLVLFARTAVAPHGHPPQASGLDGATGPAIAVVRGRAGSLSPAVDSGGGRRGDSSPGETLEHRGLPDPAVVLPAGHLQLPGPGAGRGVPADCC